MFSFIILGILFPSVTIKVVFSNGCADQYFADCKWVIFSGCPEFYSHALSTGGCGWHTKRGLEELSHIRGQGWQLGGDIHVRGQGRRLGGASRGAVAVQAQEGLEELYHLKARKGGGEEYPSSKVRSSGCALLEQL